MARQVEFVVAFVGTTLARAVAAPLNSNYKKVRVVWHEWKFDASIHPEKTTWAAQCPTVGLLRTVAKFCASRRIKAVGFPARVDFRCTALRTPHALFC
jgi:acyl-CoA synthetase (AMP-forming)/AMP-acid ligase II